MSALPNLVIIGAMKCGTTSLHEYIDIHPDTSMSYPKEVNFFSGESSSQSLDWYKSLFDPSKLIRGEASQNYAKAHHPFYRGAPERMAEIIPNCKIIYLVRDPIQRYLSHLVENYYGETDADREWNIENDHYVKTGLYYWQLSHYLKYFSIDQILVVDLAELQVSRLKVMNDIFAFLGLQQFEDASVFDFKANVFTGKSVPNFLHSNLLYRASNRFLPNVTDSFFNSKLVKERVFTGWKKRKLSMSQHEKLVDTFQSDVQKLRELVGKDFPTWSL